MSATDYVIDILLIPVVFRRVPPRELGVLQVRRVRDEHQAVPARSIAAGPCSGGRAS